MQPKSESKENFSEFARRSDQLAEELGIRVSDLPGKLGISEDMLMGYRTGRYPISSRAWRKLNAAESERRAREPEDAGLCEPPSPYGNLAKGGGASPQRAEIEARLREWLDAAERLEGGLGYASVVVRMHCRPETLRTLDPGYDPVRELERYVAERQHGGASRHRAS